MRREIIESTRKASKITIKDLIVEAGISKGAYYRAIRGENTTTKTLGKIKMALLTIKTNNMKQLLKTKGIVKYNDARFEVSVCIKNEKGKIINAAEMWAEDPAEISKIFEIQEKDLGFFSGFDATEEEETEIFMFLFDLWITKYRNFLSEIKQ